MDMQEHWQEVHSATAPDQVSWFRPHLKTSLGLIERADRSRSASIIDVGGGSSTLVDDLVAMGYGNVTILDISDIALALAKKRLGQSAESVQWICADITQPVFSRPTYDVWHDRAVFHFLTSVKDREAYVRNAMSALRIGGHVIIGTFAPEGPRRCSGLDVVRYDLEKLQKEFGQRFRLVDSLKELHTTPSGMVQPFLYSLYKLEA